MLREWENITQSADLDLLRVVYNPSLLFGEGGVIYDYRQKLFCVLPVYWIHNEEGGIKMSTIVDARGLSCPQPVLLALNAIKKIDKGEIVVLVNTDTSRENVSWAATSQGWEVKKAESEGTGYRITLLKR